jgi:signal transduction histidine kinase
MGFDGENTRIEVKDDGKGFDVEKTLQKSSLERGIGLSSMMNRTRMIGGVFTINSKPGFGTAIQIYLAGEMNTKTDYPNVED